MPEALLASGGGVRVPARGLLACGWPASAEQRDGLP